MIYQLILALLAGGVFGALMCLVTWMAMDTWQRDKKD